MRWSSRLLVLFILCLIAVAAPAAPAQAVCVPYSIELHPKSGVPGTNTTINGYGFAEDKLVDIYYEDQLVATGRTDSEGDFAFTFTVPEDSQGYYRVLADVGYAEADTYFAVRPGLTISPEQGSSGANVTVRGLGFATNEDEIELMYCVGDDCETLERHITANAQGSWQRTFQIPSSSRGEHKLDAQGAVSRIYDVIGTTFRVTAQTSIDKSSGIVGDTVTMAGSEFAPGEEDIEILFAGQAVVTGITASSKGEWEASFQVPEIPGGKHSITAQGEQTGQEDVGEFSFEIEPDVTLSPTEGYVGTDLTISGRGFAVNENLVITYDDSQVATATPNVKGSFTVSFPAPESPHGEHKVAAEHAGENHANAMFTMESIAPAAPALISPIDRCRLGFMGEEVPTFEWSAVSDDSGVAYYRLRIATSADFGPSSLILSVADLTGASYTPPEGLPQGTYYWAVQAVDRAENESDWSVPYSFRVGLLPRWGLIAAITVAGVLLLAFVIRALVRRRSIYYDRW